jgi:hypothetical protein
MIPDPLCFRCNLLYPPNGIDYRDPGFISWLMGQQVVWRDHQSQDIDTPGWRRTDATEFEQALMLATTGSLCSCDPYACVINRLIRARVLE